MRTTRIFAISALAVAVAGCQTIAAPPPSPDAMCEILRPMVVDYERATPDATRRQIEINNDVIEALCGVVPPRATE